MYVYGQSLKGTPGIPAPRPGQVYVVRAGLVYHPALCPIVQRVWEYNRAALTAVDRDRKGDRSLCRHCAQAEAPRS